LKKLSNDFNFACQRTACCCQKMEIFLNPYDILKIAETLKLSTTKVINKYITFLEDRETNLFRPILKDARKEACAFNTDKLCIIHQNRPLSCRLFPLARINGELKLQKINFCEGLKVQHKVKLADYIKEDDGIEYFAMADLYHEKYKVLKKLKKEILRDKYFQNLLNILLYDFEYFYGDDLHHLNSKEKINLSFFLVDKLIEIYQLNMVKSREKIIEKLFLEGDKFIVENFNQ